MKHYLIIVSLLLFAFDTSQAQSKIENYLFKGHGVSLFIMPFTDDNPIKIGTVSTTGDIVYEFLESFNVPDEERHSISSELWYTLFSKCDNGMELITTEDNMFSFKAGYISLLTENNKYAGILYPVQNENLIPWMEDEAYNDAIPGVYYELIYVEKPFIFSGTCTQTKPVENGDTQVQYTYNLNLKAGFNFIENKIEHVYKTDPNVMASFPDKLTVTSVSGLPNCKWLAKYF